MQILVYNVGAYFLLSEYSVYNTPDQYFKQSAQSCFLLSLDGNTVCLPSTNQEKKYQSVVLLFSEIFALEEILLCVHHYSLVYCEAKRVARIFFFFFFFWADSLPPPSLSLPLPFFFAFGGGGGATAPPWLRACVKHLRVILRIHHQRA